MLAPQGSARALLGLRYLTSTASLPLWIVAPPSPPPTTLEAAPRSLGLFTRPTCNRGLRAPVLPLKQSAHPAIALLPSSALPSRYIFTLSLTDDNPPATHSPLPPSTTTTTTIAITTSS